MTPPAQRRRISPDPASPAGRERLGRVLVVEDEQDVAELIRFNLHKEGYEVTVVGNGADGVRHARDSKPDVILLDIMVPQLNGWEVCRRLKQDGETRRIPIIMVTGRVDEGDKVLGFELGADDYVTKPFSPVSSWPGSARSPAGDAPPKGPTRSASSGSATSRSTAIASKSA